MGDRHAADALRWINGLLAEAGIAHMVVGGAAARAHGATRPIVDIDLYTPGRALPLVATIAPTHGTRPPHRHIGEHWDIVFMELDYDGQKVELGAAEDVRIFDRRSGRWSTQSIDLGEAETREVFPGIEAPVMPLDRLIRYKRLLDREVDRADLAELTTEEAR